MNKKDDASYAAEAYRLLRGNPNVWYSTHAIAKELGWPVARVAGRLSWLYCSPDYYPGLQRIDRQGKYRYVTALTQAVEPAQPLPLDVEPAQPANTFSDLVKALGEMHDRIEACEQIAHRLDDMERQLADAMAILGNVGRVLRHQAITLRGIK